MRPDAGDPAVTSNANSVVKHPSVAQKLAAVSIPIPVDFLERILSTDEKTATIPLPDGGEVAGRVTLVHRDENGLLLVQGNVTAPEAGKFMFQRQTEPGVAGPLVGHIHYDKSDVAYQVRPLGKNGEPALVKVSVDEVICRTLPACVDEAPEETPQTHPTDYPIPPGENGIIQLQSLPGATAVVYLDFDGEEDTFPSWGYINAQPSGRSASQIFDVWRGIAEDFQPFNINITTVRAVYDAAPQGRRMHAIFTPTTDASPGAGGVAYVGSFNQTGHRVCWVFYSSGKNAVEAGSHEIGHTLGLSHDGRTSPSESYYRGHNGWAPIMGVGYYQTLSQWSKGEYPSASQPQDDLNILSTRNNGVTYRTDDCGATHATSAWLDIAPGGVVSNEGIIERTGDQDGFRFTTQGGMTSLTIKNVSFNPNLDIVAEILTSAGDVVSNSDSDTSSTASFSSLNLAAGDYFLRVSGAGKGEDNLATGYTNYGSLGAYIIAGTIAGADAADHFSIVENAVNGSPVGISGPRADHGAGVLNFSISSGNAAGAFSINPSTGAIIVANSSKLDFESLSTRWDDPATFELFVSITDSLGVASELIRTVVAIGNINDAPILTSIAAQVLPENLPAGTILATASATDPEGVSPVSYSISSGNTDNSFAIDPVSGVISVAGTLDFERAPSYTLMIRATDQGTPVAHAETPFTITLLDTMEGLVPGTIVRAFYKNIGGTSVSDLTTSPKFPASPDSFETLTSFDGTANVDDNFGSTICGFLIAPVTGSYTFWIASNSASALLLSPGPNPADAVVRASLSTSTSRYNWISKSSQKSVAITLTAGQAYYIETRHKESTGEDHVAVAWQGPGMAAKEVIPGRWLAPKPTNSVPVIDSASFSIRDDAAPGSVVGTVTAQDMDVMDSLGAFAITAGNDDGAFAIDPATGVLSIALTGALDAASNPVQTLTIQVTDNGVPPLTGSGTVEIRIVGANSPPAFVTDPVLKPTAFAGVAYLQSLVGSAADADAGDMLSYSKTGGPSWLVVDSNGDLSGTPSEEDHGMNSFTIVVSDTHGGADESTLVILVPGVAVWINPLGGTWLAPENWLDGVVCGGDGSTADFSTLDLSEDAFVTLEVGRTVGNLIFGDTTPGNNWTLTSGTSRPLTLFVADGIPEITVNNGSAIIDLELAGSQGLVKEGSGTLVVAGSTSYTGATAVTAGELCVNGSMASPSVSVGPGSKLCGSGFLTGSISVSGQLSPGNGTGELASGPVSLENGATLSWQASDWAGVGGAGYDKLTSTSLDLSDATSLHLSLHELDLANFTDTAKTFTVVETAEGITGFTAEKFIIDGSDFPSASGTWVIRIDGNDLLLDYTPLNSAPIFTVSPIDGGNAPVGDAFSLSIADLATDANSGDSLSYTKISGPDWLQVSSGGELTGTPPLTSIGLNSFEVRVTDPESLGDTANLVIDVTGTPWQTWQSARFAADADTGGTAGDLDDPDHDGFVNLLEYVLALDPTLADSTAAALTHDVEAIGGKDYLRLTVSRNPAASDVLLEVEVSGDMITWRTDQTLIETNTGSSLQVRDTVPLDSGESRFIRVKAMRAASTP